MLLDEGMQVRILELDGELDPDEYCKERGPEAYAERLEGAKGYFFWLADRARDEVSICARRKGKSRCSKFLHAGGAAHFRSAWSAWWSRETWPAIWESSGHGARPVPRRR